MSRDEIDPAEHEWRIAVGKIGEPVAEWFATLADAEAWIAEMEEIDPDGVHRGEYFIDVPEDYPLALSDTRREATSASSAEYPPNGGCWARPSGRY